MPALPAGAVTKAECQKAARKAVPECVKACKRLQGPKRYKSICRRGCRSRRYKKTYVTQCLASFGNLSQAAE